MSSPKKNNNKDEKDNAPPMIRSLTQTETLKDANLFFKGI